MRLVVPLRPILWWAQGALLPPPARCWLYCGFVLMDSWVFQNDESSQLERLIADRKATSDLASPEHLPPSPPSSSREPVQKRSGAPSATLPAPPFRDRWGTWAFPDTVTRFFAHCETSGEMTSLWSPRCLANIVTASPTTVVSPDDVAVLNSTGDEILTLITCYPFYFVGSAPERFIVRAEGVTTQTDLASGNAL